MKGMPVAVIGRIEGGMAIRFIPRSDSEAAALMRLFANELVSRPEIYHVSPEMAEAVREAVVAFRSSLATTLNRAIRNHLSVVHKNECRAAAEQICRRVAILVRADPAVGDADKVKLGIRPRKKHISRSKAPMSYPILIPRVSGRALQVEWRDFNSPDRKAKPAGCAMLQLFYAVADKPVNDLSAMQLLNVYTSNQVRLAATGMNATIPGTSMSFADDGERRVVTFIARWAGPKGQPGPWSEPASVRIAA